MRRLEHLNSSTMGRGFRPKVAAVAVLVGTLVIGSVVPSTALPGASRSSLLAGEGGAAATKAAFRGHVDYDPARHRGHHGQTHRAQQGWGYGGAAIGAGVAGLAAGAMLDAAGPRPAEPTEEAISYCFSRFRSYDPSTGTYVGYDGNEHPCP